MSALLCCAGRAMAHVPSELFWDCWRKLSVTVCQIPLGGKCTHCMLEELDEEEKIWKKSQKTKKFG